MPKSWLFVRYTKDGFENTKRENLPDWIGAAWDASDSPDEMEVELVKQSADRIEQVGFGDCGVDIWRHKNAWLVQHFASNMLDTHIVITDVLDYLHFQAHWFAPMATKILLNDIAWKLFDAEDENQPPAGALMN